jgi:hypothetical protein
MLMPTHIQARVPARRRPSGTIGRPSSPTSAPELAGVSGCVIVFLHSGPEPIDVAVWLGPGHRGVAAWVQVAAGFTLGGARVGPQLVDVY